jgi:hypothetical protein
MNNQLNILDLHRTIMEKKNRRYEAFEKVLSICHKRIKDSAEHQQLKTLIVVPEFIVGYPIFNMNECLEYIIDSMKKNGLYVKYFFPNILYVSWDYVEIENDKKPVGPPVAINVQKPKTLLTSNIMTSMTTNKNGKFRLEI